MKKKIFFTCMVIIMMIAGTLQLANITKKVALTSFELIILHDNAEIYNRLERKTDVATNAYEQDLLRRQQLYNSQDCIIRWYARSNTAVKVVVALITYFMPILLVVTWLMMLVNFISRRKKKTKTSQKNPPQ